MNLIAPLIAGIRGAENGSVLLYKRGTTNPATYFTTFEASATILSTTAGLPLDANGGIEVYVNEYVDVIVRDSNGNTVRAFTAGESSPAVEVRSQSFTGTSYTSAASASGSPITLQAVLDLWYTKNGAIDWLVGFNGSSASIKSALSMLNGKLFYNVKDDAYGATGNGATDDTTAIQSAINAAAAAGGGTVVFPAGTYKISTELTIGAGVSLWGVAPPTGTAGVVIATSSATAHILRFTASASYEVRGLTLSASVSNSGALAIVATGLSPLIHFFDCWFSGLNLTGHLTRGHGFVFTECVFVIAPTTNQYAFNQVDTSTPSDAVHFTRCLFQLGSTGAYTPADGLINSKAVVLIDCIFDIVNMTSGTAYMLDCEAAVYCVALGNRVIAPTGGTVRLFDLGAVTKDTRIFEDFNIVEGSEGSSTLGLYRITSVTGAAASFWQGFWLGSRERNSLNIADDSASLALSALQYALIVNKRGNGTVQTITTDAVIPNGSLTLITKNATGGAGGNITVDTGSFRPTETFSIATNNNFDIRRWRGMDADGTVRWYADAGARNNV